MVPQGTWGNVPLMFHGRWGDPNLHPLGLILLSGAFRGHDEAKLFFVMTMGISGRGVGVGW